MSDSHESTGSDQLDYAIVGGGVSGLYAAWRLLVDARERGLPQRSVSIFEMGERVGGRLLTWLPLGPDAGLRGELGGMRFFSQQELVWSLLTQLGFGDDDIIDFLVEGPGLRLLLRGVSNPLDDPDPTARYDVAPEEKMAAGALLQATIDAILATPDNQAVLDQYSGGKIPADRAGWDKIKPYLTWGGKPNAKAMWDLGIWNVISDIRTAEAYQFMSDAFGYYSLIGNWNSAEAMQSIALDFTQNPAYKTLVGGYSALPDALAAQVIDEGGTIHLETRVARFAPAPGGLVELDLQSAEGSSTVMASNVILGLPRRSLELLAPSPGFDMEADASLKRLVESVTSYPAFKLFLLYDERWWERLGILHGRSICDLPLRQTYYFAPDSQPGHPQPPFGLLMASYDDAHAVDYWQGLVPPEDQWPERREQLRQALAGLADRAGVEESNIQDPPPHLHLATDDMLRHAKSQLALLHDIDESQIPDPLIGAFADWGLDPFGGGWNFWSPQVNVKDVMTRIKTPVGPGSPVYLVGEAYSGAQGWVEGALTTTELVLQDKLGLKPPAWLPSDYWLGW